MDLTEFKARQRTTWETGDYRPIGRLLDPAAQTLVHRAGVTAGQRVLDVGTGSGSVAVAAARAGASVVGVDITDRWFDEAQRRADAADVDIELMVGDAENLPADTASFDVVLSSFAAIFAPRHDAVAAELTRVCRRGGTIGMTAWPPDGANWKLFSTLSEALPSPPAFVMPPGHWGEPDYVRRLFSRHRASVVFERPSFVVRFDSVDAFESFVFDNSGGYISARHALRQAGRWEQTYASLHRAVEEANEARDGTYRVTWDYLLIIAAMPG